MALAHPRAPSCLPWLIAGLLSASPALALRIVDYNIMQYPNTNGTGRNPYFRTLMQPLGADLVVVEEIMSQAGVDSFRTNVLNALEPGMWSSAAFTNGHDTDNMLFYKSSKVTLLGQRSFYVASDLFRLVNEYRLRPVGYSSVAADFYLYSVHFKSSSADSARRQREATGLRDTLNHMPPGSHMIVVGDFNIYRSTEMAMQRLTEDQADDDGRLYDPLNLIGEWSGNPGIAPHHSQSPSTDAYRPSTSYMGGGINDRLDMFLPTLDWNDGQGYELLVPTYVVIGNDGQHLNKAVTEPPIAPADTAYARALWWGSDHLPIRVDIQVPARVTTPASLALGTVIVGGGGDLPVQNIAIPPADDLTYSFAAPPGFTIAAGTHALAAGAPPALHLIGTGPGPAGSRAGNLTITTDDPDQPNRLVGLTATVLDHAAVSLDSSSVTLAGMLDFGSHAAGAFPTLPARVHNFGYDAQQARLFVNGANISGGAGRFSIVGGFSPALVAGTGATWAVRFDDSGSAADSTYEATLAFSSVDEPLPGGAAQPAAGCLLRARRVGGAVDVPGPDRPAVTRLRPPAPNPLVGSSTLQFDLATRGDVRLEVLDLSGRRVAQIAAIELDPGHYGFAWDGRGDTGRRLAAGLYFVRLSGHGFREQVVRLALVR